MLPGMQAPRMHRQDVYSTQGDSNLKTDRRAAIGLVGIHAFQGFCRPEARSVMRLPGAQQISIGGYEPQHNPCGAVGVCLGHQVLRSLLLSPILRRHALVRLFPMWSRHRTFILPARAGSRCPFDPSSARTHARSVLPSRRTSHPYRARARGGCPRLPEPYRVYATGRAAGTKVTSGTALGEIAYGRDIRGARGARDRQRG